MCCSVRRVVNREQLFVGVVMLREVRYLVYLRAAAAALIQMSCHVKHKDIRKFLDGIYVSEKGPIGAVKPI